MILQHSVQPPHDLPGSGSVGAGTLSILVVQVLSEEPAIRRALWRFFQFLPTLMNRHLDEFAPCRIAALHKPLARSVTLAAAFLDMQVITCILCALA
jgi:hypothetical protein